MMSAAPVFDHSVPAVSNVIPVEKSASRYRPP
jgi:hypothetical protein